MKILYPSFSYPPYISGSILMVQRLAESFAHRRHQVLVLTTSQKGTPYQEKKGNLTVIYLASFPLSKTIKLYAPYPQPQKIRQIVARFQPDVIHLHDPHPSLTLLNFARDHHIPLVATHHFTPEFFLSKSPLLKPLIKKTTPKTLILRLVNTLYNRCQAVTVPNPLILKQLKKAGLKPPAYYISNGVNLQLFHPRKKSPQTLKSLGLEPHLPTFIFTGVLRVDKNLPLLLQAFSLIDRATFPCQLLLVGSGKEEKKLKKLGQKLKISSSLFFAGKTLNFPYLARLYATSFAFVNPSIIENQSLATLEALASGLPVIATQSLGQKPLVKNGQNGFLVPPNDPQALAAAMEKLLKNPSLRQKMSVAARQTALEHDFQKTLDQFEKLYTSLSSS